ncbi:hypothetical protein MBLNU230_g6891t1 [Neophaeotheca triangularis]
MSLSKIHHAQVTEERTEERISVEEGEGRQRERQQSSSSNVGLPRDRKDERYTREEVRFTDDDRQRPGRVSHEEDVRVYRGDRRDTTVVNERYREPYQRYAGAQLDVEDRVYDNEQQYNTRHSPTNVDYNSRLDNFEQDYRQRTTPYAEQYQDKSTYPRDYPEQTGFDERVRTTETHTVDPRSPDTKSKRDMGYYDEDGHYHSFRHGLHRAADRVLHPIHGGDHSHSHSHSNRQQTDDISEDRVVSDREVQVSQPRRQSGASMPRRFSERSGVPNTITIPCHHIRIGDLLILQGRPCQVIRITTSAQTGQHRYLGVDLFTKQLHEESSFVSNPSPSVVVQNMLGPVFKQYRVLDIRDDGRVVAMTETGDVKQGLPVLDQSSLLARLNDSFNDGRGSVRVLVINDEGREMAVDYKVVHGSRL